MRGEDRRLLRDLPSIIGSPPHARGRLVIHSFQMRVLADHPRMRGEDSLHLFAALWRDGSPPHARGRRSTNHPGKGCFRITPACAGKTKFLSDGTIAHKDHPRMRGED